MTEDSERLRELVAEVAAAYFANSHVNPAEIPAVVRQIADSLSAVGNAGAAPAAAPQEEVRQKLTPGQIRKSITEDALISFEDNKPYKTLKRHLTGRGLTPAQYREKWGLPKDYPTVAPSYSAKRASLAKNMGLGQARAGKAAAAPAASTPAPAAPAKRRGRPKKTA